MVILKKGIHFLKNVM